ncbi:MULTISPECIES: pantothenate kinase [unclassified Pseudomonas]|uniref:pantothenate kinase n=1 Tax=unclassified Pseudomonas TaxID=196821 RepID=UPI00244AB7E0|nr:MULTISPECIES: pantothenate kinase [unclassified Pseudomonas]MDG9925009.1 pantothenate kinase [Pseudomonas sp. GD04045]MDH0037116.1 pantothenate kinase [Pseudomonas sp. GD04019]
MILELDCGNSLIKWRVQGGGQMHGGVVDSDERLLEALRDVAGLSLLGCRLVSVRSDAETSSLVGVLEAKFGVEVLCAQPALQLAGVRNGYDDYARLGLDRWLAVVGAYQLEQGACLVLDLGTAVTSDLVTADGEHLGGYICPGLPLMRNQLRTHTRRIRYDDAEAELAMHSLQPGRVTVEAVERGCALMLRGFVLTQVELARELLGEAFGVYLTGGDAGLVSEVLPQARQVSDLVFVGLAQACPLPVEGA